MRLFDLHCDTLYECCTGDSYLQKNSCHVDLTRGLRYDAWAQVFAVWMPDTIRGEEAFIQCRTMLEFAHSQAELYHDQMRIICKANELAACESDHRCAAILAVEGGSALAGQLEHIADLANLDVKIITLTWNGSNELGHGSGSGCSDGLLPFGKAAVIEMERLGILPDVSHLNERGFWDVESICTRPFIASHSVSAGVNPHKRNLTDRQFAAIRDRGGLVGLNFCAAQLGGFAQLGGVGVFDAVERHLYHYLSLGGERTVAFGCDMDGTDLPSEWDGIAVMQKLYAYLLRKNYEEDCLNRIFFSNCYDFFQRL